MKTGSEKEKTTTLELDVRVRGRLLANGVLTSNIVERHLAELPDLETQSEALLIEQPALGGGASEPPARTAPQPAGSA